VTTINVVKVFEDLPRVWAGYLQDWDRTMRSRNHPETTRYNYVLAAAQLARYLREHSPDFESDAAADDPTQVTKRHVEAFQAWVIETRSASTALNKHKALQQFFKWLVIDEEEMDRSPMDRVGQPKTPQKLIPVLSDEDTKKVLDLCKGKSFANLRDQAIVRLLCNTGARLSEVGDLTFDDIDLATESVRFRGKGARDRRVRFGPKTARALSRYLRARATHRGNELPFLWLADRGGRRLAPNGIKIMLRRLGEKAGIERLHAHRWRHSYAHEWKRAGADTGDLMLVLGWTSDAMPRHYGRSAAAERALETQQRLGIGERV
jgi:site-specific recombinase XerD